MAEEGVIAVKNLTAPGEAQANSYLQECSFEDRLVGVIMKASGTLPMDIYSLEQALGFFAHDNSEVMGRPDAVIQERRLDVAYIAPGRLARWIREIIGDGELADAIEAGSAEIEDPDIYPPRMQMMRELVVTRVMQCYDVLGIKLESGDDERAGD